jgi:uncharacterized membrane protein YhaH (DUF805 family)
MYQNDFTFTKMLAAYRRPHQFAGRSTRTELLGYLIISWALATIFGYLVIGAAIAGLKNVTISSDPTSNFLTIDLFNLLFWLPFPALAVRRFHDQNRSGWWAAPIVASTILSWIGAEGLLAPPVRIILGLLYAVALILLFWKPTDGANRYGFDPRLELDDVEFATD